MQPAGRGAGGEVKTNSGAYVDVCGVHLDGAGGCTVELSSHYNVIQTSGSTDLSLLSLRGAVRSSTLYSLQISVY